MTPTRTGLGALALAGAIIITVAALVQGRPTPATLPMPPTLGRIPLLQTVAGREARAVVDSLHQRGVAPPINRIGVYAHGTAQGTLYGSLYTSAPEAREAWGTMRTKIRAGNSPFTHAVDLERGGRTVSMCFGQGQIHFLVADGRRLYWLAADPQVADLMLDDLLASLRVAR